MKTDKDPNQAKLDEKGQGTEENQDSSLEWLLDMHHEEQEETLFQVSNSEYHDEGLSAFLDPHMLDRDLLLSLAAMLV